MTQKPEETIARLLELEAECTGKWTGVCTDNYAGESWIRVCVTREPNLVNTSDYTWEDASDADVALMAEAHTAVDAIRQLLATMAVMAEAVIYGADPSRWLDDFGVPDFVYTEALAAYAPFRALAEKAGV